MSNTVVTSMFVPVFIGISQAANLNPVIPAVAVCLGTGISYSLPVSTPPNAIVYATGLVPLGTMIRYGILFNVVCFVMMLAGLRILGPLLGFG